jgi:hypothetical protein
MDFKKYNLKKIFLIVIWAILLLIAIGSAISPDVSENNTTLINGHYNGIEKGIGKGRNNGSVWYDLFIQESNRSYRISADNSHCVLYDNIVNELKLGEQIRMYINKPTPFFSIRKPMVVGIIVNGKNYLSFDCVNNETNDERFQIPFFCVVMGLLVGYLIYRKEIVLK